MRHKNAKSPYTQHIAHRTIGLPTHVPTARVPGYTDEQTAKRDAEALDKLRAQRPLKPPQVKR